MLKYEVRFWDRDNKKMILGAGMSPRQLPLVKRGDGTYDELQGRFVPMLNTTQKALNGLIWEGDIIECDMPVMQIEGLPPTFQKLRGVMQFNQQTASFTVNIATKSPAINEATFGVVNSRIVGDVFSTPELLKTIPSQNDSTKTAPPKGADV